MTRRVVGPVLNVFAASGALLLLVLGAMAAAFIGNVLVNRFVDPALGDGHPLSLVALFGPICLYLGGLFVLWAVSLDPETASE